METLHTEQLARVNGGVEMTDIIPGALSCVFGIRHNTDWERGIKQFCNRNLDRDGGLAR